MGRARVFWPARPKGKIMSNMPLHEGYRHYAELPSSQRVLYTATLLILGLGYLFALIFLFHTYAGRAGGNPMMLSYEDLVVAYSGSGTGSRLESALHGPMATMLPYEESNALIGWVHAGADRPNYEKDIKPILDKRCMACHDGSNPHLPTLAGYDNLKKVTEQDTGANVFTLVRVSHIHLFGLTFIFFIVGLMYSHAYVRPVWFKCTVIALPFVAIVLDVSSWYFTKLYHPFALVVMGGGALMGLCFAFMWVTTIYQIWFAATPAVIINRKHGDSSAI
jgi:hypothetical protein